MGLLNIQTSGSFKSNNKTFSAMKNGHAQAVAEAIKFLSEKVLPEAIAQDHELQSDNCYPGDGFRKQLRGIENLLESAEYENDVFTVHQIKQALSD